MNRLTRLSEQIREECAALGNLVQRSEEAWEKAQRTNDDLYLDSVALSLHGFYNGVERVFERVAIALDGSLPEGSNWHRQLLDQMAEEMPATRPAVISLDTRDRLDGYRGFRHIVRNVYTFQLEQDKIQPLMEGLPGLSRQVLAELSSFEAFLGQRG